MTSLRDMLDQGTKEGHLVEIRNWVKRYPYAGPLRMLLARTAEVSGDLERREELLRAGAHVPSRSALLAYFMGPALREVAAEVHREVDALPEVSEEELVQLVWHDRTEATPTPSDPPTDSEVSVDVPDDASHEPPAPAEGRSGGPDNAADTTEDATAREAMVAAIASVIEQEVVEWVAPEPPQPEAPPVDDVQVAEPQSMFAKWLRQRALETGFGGAEQVERGATALIDAFLAKGDVRIGPVRDSLPTTEEWAKQGLVEDPSLVTETMAKLYAQQGQIGRARKAYKLLALKYPEKSVYFAAQLKKLRNS